MVVRHLLGKPLVVQPAVQGTLSCATWDAQLTRVGIKPAGDIGRALKRAGQRMYAAADAYVLRIAGSPVRSADPRHP